MKGARIGKKKGVSRRPRAKGERGRGPMVLCWRMYNLELPVAVDPGKDFCGVSPEVRFGCEKGYEVGPADVSDVT